MEDPLTCNNLNCRKELTDRAVVTTCSHIFCFECVKQLGFSGPEGQGPNSCPVCRNQLAKPDAVVYANLNPTEEFKTCVLSGLSPNIVMECAGRAISFWAYQSTQNLQYQRYLYRTLSGKYSELQAQCDQMARDAEAKINRLRENLESMTKSRDLMLQRNKEFAEALQAKTRTLHQTQELYNRVKRKAEFGQLERAACDAVDSSIRQFPQATINSQEQQAFFPPHLNDPRERSYSLGHGLRVDNIGLTTGPSGPSMQQSDHENPWAGNSTLSHGKASHQ
ncbi:hypothetical protein V8C35DRAFT_58876 [Trichoderma chlorosporum]